MYEHEPDGQHKGTEHRCVPHKKRTNYRESSSSTCKGSTEHTYTTRLKVKVQRNAGENLRSEAVKGGLGRRVAGQLVRVCGRVAGKSGQAVGS